MNTNSNIEEIIAKHLAGESNTAEEGLLNSWLAEKEANRTYYHKLELIFQQSNNANKHVAVDTDAAWIKLKASMDKGRKSVKPISFSYNAKLVWRMAAVFLLVAGLGITLFVQRNKKEAWKIETAANVSRLIHLPDSSSVYLNKNSTLQYSYTSNRREIKLNGEAFFEVRHNAAQTFIVKAGELEIKDIGTAFNVNTKAPQGVEVFVQEGEVALITENHLPIALHKGEKSLYDTNTHLITRLSIRDPNELSYLTKVFVFENASLANVVSKLNTVYRTQIKINGGIKDCRLSATFKNEKIDTIVEVIAETFQLKISRNNGVISLEGQGCEN